jgi:hypothetical protein
MQRHWMLKVRMINLQISIIEHDVDCSPWPVITGTHLWNATVMLMQSKIGTIDEDSWRFIASSKWWFSRGIKRFAE